MTEVYTVSADDLFPPIGPLGDCEITMSWGANLSDDYTRAGLL